MEGSHIVNRVGRARSRLTHRSVFLGSGAAAFASVAVVRAPARAAEFSYKFGNPNPVDLPTSVRVVQMANAIKAETNGRLEITVFPNSSLGSSTSMMEQLRLGTIQFLELSLANASGIVPAGGIETVGYAFRSDKQFYASMDGALGAYLRSEFLAKGFYIFERPLSLGARQITSSNHPIRTADDLAGFRLRTLTSPLVVDLLRTLGASPVPLDSSEMYTSLQSHLIDGVDLPVNSILAFRIYEVQKYVSITNHIMQPYWIAANVAAWNALPADIQAVVTRNAAKYALIERNDMAISFDPVVSKLKRLGLAFNDADVASMRARLGPYYARCKNVLGNQAWSLLEHDVGKLA